MTDECDCLCHLLPEALSAVHLFTWMGFSEKKKKIKFCLQKMRHLIFDLAKAAFKVLVLLVYAARLASWLNGASWFPNTCSQHRQHLWLYCLFNVKV